MKDSEHSEPRDSSRRPVRRDGSPSGPVRPGGPGRLSAPTGSGESGSVECGSLVNIDIEVHDGVVSDSRYQAYGCPATLAAAAATARAVLGLPILVAAALTAEDVAAQAELEGGLLSRAETAIDALHGALGAAVTRASGGLRDPAAGVDPRGVLVGMSGGVDSAVAAMLLQREGYHVLGATLSLWKEEGATGERSCCSPETVRLARRVAHRLGIPHLTIDARNVFADRVVRYFVEEYEAGRTPNPCAKCNARVRMGLMLDVAEQLGLARIATGHYARHMGAHDRLSRGSDSTKDQSYVLAEVDPGLLRRVIFPLGEWNKPRVRALAAEAGLEGHSAPESQEICFVADDDHRRFLRERLGERPGPILDTEGRRLGSHDGTYNYTIGQRKGLGISSAAPLYVVSVDADESAVIVGPAEALNVRSVTIASLTWHGTIPAGSIFLQVRSSGEPATGRVVVPSGCLASDSPERVIVELDTPLAAVACGQTAVVYDGDQVVCAGTIVTDASSDVDTGRSGRPN